MRKELLATGSVADGWINGDANFHPECSFYLLNGKIICEYRSGLWFTFDARTMSDAAEARWQLEHYPANVRRIRNLKLM